MADSVDRVFVHALNTVKKIPKTGASRPPPADRLRLYGLYKQAMEGDVDGVMERPGSAKGEEDEEMRKDRDKYDAWDAQKGCSRTEAKRRYIEALIETMHKYASTTADARALVDELEFVWDQIKNNSISSSGSSPGRGGSRLPPYTRTFQAPLPGTEGPMRVLSPMSQDDEAENRSSRRLSYPNNNPDYTEDSDYNNNEGTEGKQQEKKVKKWRKTVEMALVKMTAEIAALREQISTGREYQGRRRRTAGKWIKWVFWGVVRHLFLDAFFLGLVLLWLRRRRDRRVEDLVREGLKIGREYVRAVVPPR